MPKPNSTALEFRVRYPSGITVEGFDTAIEAYTFGLEASGTIVESRTKWKMAEVTAGCEDHLHRPDNLCADCWAVEP